MTPHYQTHKWLVHRCMFQEITNSPNYVAVCFNSDNAQMTSKMVKNKVLYYPMSHRRVARPMIIATLMPY